MSSVPRRFVRFMAKYPDIDRAYRALGDGAANAGPLDDRTRALIKLGIAIGARHEGATHSQARKALEAGATEDELLHAAILSVTTLGFPNMMAAYSWIEDVLAAREPTSGG